MTREVKVITRTQILKHLYGMLAMLALAVIAVGSVITANDHTQTAVVRQVISRSHVAHDQQVIVGERSDNPNATSLVSNKRFLIALEGDMSSDLLAYDQSTKALHKVADLGCNAIARMSPDRQLAYIFDQDAIQSQAWTGGLYAIDVNTGERSWQVDIPGVPFGPSTNGIWTSANGQLLYLQGSRDGLNPRIFVVDIPARQLIREVEIPLPYPPNLDDAFPVIWKSPRSEALVVASRDKLFTLDLETGVVGASTDLFTPESLNRIPTDLPRSPFVWAGLIADDGRKLLLATSTQEILQVSLGESETVISRVVALPNGWRFANAVKPMAADPQLTSLYVAVTDGASFGRATQIWQYDVSSWAREASVSLTGNLQASGILYGIERDAISGDIHLYGSEQILTVGGKAIGVLQPNGVSLSELITDGGEALLDPARILKYDFLD